jgi:hypothetical protein
MTDQTPTALPDTADLKAALDKFREVAGMLGSLQWQVQRIARAFDVDDYPEHALVEGDEIPTFAHIGELYVFVDDARDRISECSLELFNHVAEQASYRICANRTCGRLFVRQEGRAKAEQYRLKGVLFCSASCARAETQRQYRKKKAARDRASEDLPKTEPRKARG